MLIRIRANEFTISVSRCNFVGWSIIAVIYSHTMSESFYVQRKNIVRGKKGQDLEFFSLSDAQNLSATRRCATT